MSKQYFLRDEEIHSVNEDYFRHRDVAKNITRILETNNPPYNIAVIGKWGLGKSSLINLVTDTLMDESEKYIKIDINAWKYEKEVLGKVFLRQVSQELDEKFKPETKQDERKNFFRRIWEFICKKDEKSFSKLFFEQLKASWKFLIVYALVMLIVYAIYKVVVLWNGGELPITLLKFCALVFTGYCRNIAVLLFAPILLACSAQIISDMRKYVLDKAQFRLQEINIEDYEIELQRKIKSIVKEDETLKILIVLDDLDRLSFPKMVEALNALKMFINFHNCIFIVPFDDEIIKSAIESVKNNEYKQYTDSMESELLLDKLFQYKVYLAPLLDYDIKNYAAELCIKNMRGFIEGYCNEELFETVIRKILIHDQVETPRQVKKIVNVFATNMMIARERELNGKVEKGFATSDKGVFAIAKLSVLQADFNEFYDLLFVVPDAIDIVLEMQNTMGKVSNIEIPIELRKYFGIEKEKQNFSKEYIPLLNFLKKTAKYEIVNIMPYLYVAMEDISVLTGSVKQQEFIRAATSGNLTETRRMLKETPQLIESFILHMQQRNYVDDLKNLMKCILQDITQFNPEDRKRVASTIAERAGEIANSWTELDEKDLNYEGLLLGYEVCDNKNEFKKILVKSLSNNYAGRSEEKISAFSKSIRMLDNTELNCFYNYIKRLLDEDLVDLDSFITIKRINKLSNKEWLDQYYKYLIRNISNNKEKSNRVLVELKNTFMQMLAKKDINYCFSELKPLYSTTYITTLFKDYLLGANNLDPDMLNELVRQRIMNKTVDEQEFRMLLKCIDGKMEVVTSRMIDRYITSIIEKGNAVQLICLFAEDNDVNLINNSVREMIKWIFAETNGERVEHLRLLMKVIGDDGREGLLSEIKNACTISKTKTYVNLKKVVEIIADYEWNEFVSYIISLADTIENEEVNDSYIDFVSYCFSRIEKHLTELEINKYVDGLCSKIKQNKCIDTSIKAIKAFVNKVSDEKFLEIESTIFDVVNESNCKEVYLIYTTRLRMFSKKYENIDHLADVCLMAIEYTNLQNEAIETLDEGFRNISKVVKLVGLIINDVNINKTKAYKVVRKFLNNKEISFATKNILLILKKYGKEVTYTILGDNKEEMLDKMTSYIIENVDEFSTKDLLNYINWLIEQDNISYNKSINSLVSSVVDMCDMESEYEEIVEILENMGSHQYRECSKKYLDPIVNLLRKISSVELKRRLVIVARRLRISKEVFSQLPEVLLYE